MVVIVLFLGVASGGASLFSWYVMSEETSSSSTDRVSRRQKTRDDDPYQLDSSKGNGQQMKPIPSKEGRKLSREPRRQTDPFKKLRSQLDAQHRDLPYQLHSADIDVFVLDERLGDAGTRLIEKAGRYLQAHRQFLLDQRLFRTNEEKTFRRLVIVIYDQNSSYRSYSQTHDLPSWMNSHYEPEYHKIVTFLPDRREQLYSALLHESSHAFFDQVFGDIDRFPFWVVEGMATLVETGKVSGFIRGASLDVQPHSSMLRAWQPEGLMNRGDFSFKAFLQFRREDVFREVSRNQGGNRRRTLNQFYSHSWALTYFLWKQYGLDRIGRFIRRLQNRETVPASFRTVFDAPKQVLKEYRQYITNMK